jgi:hypothetical protein
MAETRVNRYVNKYQPISQEASRAKIIIKSQISKPINSLVAPRIKPPLSFENPKSKCSDDMRQLNALFLAEAS